jgi:hypothetical protein
VLTADDNKNFGPLRLIGWSLLGLSLLANLAMAHHPYITQPDPQGHIKQMAQIGSLTAYVHSLLILVVIAYTWLFMRYSTIKNTAVVWQGSSLFALGSLAMIGAALISGFLSPSMTLSAELTTPEQLAIFKFQSRLMWKSNQLLANAGTIAWLLALIFWGYSLLRNSKLAFGVGLLGLLIAGVGLFGIITGSWRLNVTGMSITAFAITLWFCTFAGYLLWSTRQQHKGAR